MILTIETIDAIQKTPIKHVRMCMDQAIEEVIAATVQIEERDSKIKQGQPPGAYPIYDIDQFGSRHHLEGPVLFVGNTHFLRANFVDKHCPAQSYAYNIGGKILWTDLTRYLKKCTAATIVAATYQQEQDLVLLMVRTGCKVYDTFGTEHTISRATLVNQ